MTAIAKLIRYHRFRLDEKRRALREAEETAAEISRAIETLSAEIETEKRVAAENPQSGQGFGHYIRAALDRRQALRQSHAEAMQKVATARDEVREAFAEVKKFEITKASRDAEETQEAERRERIDLDEVALNNYRRR